MPWEREEGWARSSVVAHWAVRVLARSAHEGEHYPVALAGACLQKVEAAQVEAAHQKGEEAQVEAALQKVVEAQVEAALQKEEDVQVVAHQMARVVLAYTDYHARPPLPR